MGLRFYFGGSGAGKSTSLHKEMIERSMAEPNRNFLIIVPDQFTMQTQMDLVTAHPDRGIMNIDVLSFGRLSHRIMEEVGGDRREVLDDTGKSLILRKVSELIEEEMPVIGSNLGKLGYIHEVKSAISEFMQYGIGEKELDELIAYTKKRGALHHKLKDLRVLYLKFLSYIKEKYITTEETLDLVRRVLPKSKLIQNSVIAFDGFTGFTPIQNRLIQELMIQADEVIITAVMDTKEDPYMQDGEQKLFYLTKKTVADLHQLAKEVNSKTGPDVMLRDNPMPRFRNNKEMQHLEQYLFRYPVVSYEEENRSIHMFEASSPGEEVRQVCIRIRELIRTKHYCYRDFAIVAGDLGTYEGYLETETAKYKIPVFMDRTKGIILNPFTEYIRSALKIIWSQFSYEAVFHYLRSGLAGFTGEEVDRLENYVLSKGIKGKKRWTQIFTSRKKDGGEEVPEELNRLRESLIGQLAPLMEKEKTGTAGEKVRALYAFITANHVQEKLEAFAGKFRVDNDLSRAREYEQIYPRVMDLLDQIESLLSAEKVGRKEFADILDAGFGEIKVGTIPQNVDRVVAGDIERTRLKEIKVLFFIGINDGNIPKNTGTGGIISDIDREFLQEAPYALAPSPRMKMYTQRLYLYMNMTKPSEHLYLSCSKVSGDGKSLRPAYLFDTVKKLFVRMEIGKPELRAPEKQLEGKAAGLDCFTDLLRLYAAGALSEEERRLLYAFYHIYRKDSCYQEEVGQLLETAFTRYFKHALTPKVAGGLYGKLLVGSVSRLERYAACAYAHFLAYGLELKEREEYGFEAIDMGNVFHGVLELFAGKLEENGNTWFDFGEEQADDLLTQALDTYAASYGESVLYSSARNEYALSRMHRILKRTVMTLKYQLKKGSFLPENYELSFAMTDNLESVNIALSGDEKMKLRGRIDRIDTQEEEECVYVKVIDYKSGNKKFDLAALYYGLQLQLVVYMNAALEMEKKKHPDKEVIPAALLYYHVADPMVKSDEEISPEEINREILKELRMTGIVSDDDEVIRMMDKDFTDKSDTVPVERKKDGSFSAGSGVISKEDLREISQYVNNKIAQAGREILQGNMEINPCDQGNATACDYCIYRQVCGFDTRIDGYEYRTLEKLADEEAIERIREINGNTIHPGTAEGH